MARTISRRGFMTAATGAAVGVAGAPGGAPASGRLRGRRGQAGPARRQAGPQRRPSPRGPSSTSARRRRWLEVLHSGKWFRGDGQTVNRFEQAYAKLTGAKHCVATANGTSALFASLARPRRRPGRRGDRPALHLRRHAQRRLAPIRPAGVRRHRPRDLPDRRPQDRGRDHRAHRRDHPVHLGGNVCDLDTILAIAERRKLPVIEDACQAHLAEWRGRKVGTWAPPAASASRPARTSTRGEGGAILTSDDELAERCYAFHNNGRARRGRRLQLRLLGGRGANLRMTEFQAALLLAQMTRLEEQSKTREENAQYLTQQLSEIPGILPAQDARGLHPQRLPPLHVPLRAGAVRRPAAREVPQGPVAPRASPAPAATRR